MKTILLLLKPIVQFLEKLIIWKQERLRTDIKLNKTVRRLVSKSKNEGFFNREMNTSISEENQKVVFDFMVREKMTTEDFKKVGKYIKFIGTNLQSGTPDRFEKHCLSFFTTLAIIVLVSVSVLAFMFIEVKPDFTKAIGCFLMYCACIIFGVFMGSCRKDLKNRVALAVSINNYNSRLK